MLKSYRYLHSNHSKLHEFIIAFFNRIENETGRFQLSFFETPFQDIVVRHPSILMKRCKAIFNILRRWSHADRSMFCQRVRESNDIEGICEGTVIPLKVDDISADLRILVKQLFLDLYKQVLDGPAFTLLYGKLRDHFDQFRKLNSDITICPICGISELKTQFDKSRDQYDHYLPKAIYPLSSVNFKNLVPVCKECNSVDAKGEKDTIAVSSGKLFFPFDREHKGIKIDLSILKDDRNIDNIEWGLSLTSPDGKLAEVQSWRSIYDIDSRYIGLVQGRMHKWYKAYWEYKNDKDLSHLSDADRELTYSKYMEKDAENQLNYIRKPALEAFLSGSVLARAESEAKLYS